jgi:hypothetical protein
MRRCRFILALGAMLAFGASGATAQPPLHPARFGVDSAGQYHLVFTDLDYWSHEPFYAALDEFDFGYVVIHLYPVTEFGADSERLTIEKMAAMDRGMRSHGKTYTLNLEDSNFTIRREIVPGVNEYDAPGGLHRWDLRPSWFAPAIEENFRTGFRSLLGVVYDEPTHMQNESNRFANNAEPPFIEPNTYDVPYLAATHGMEVVASHEAVFAEALRLRAEHYPPPVEIFTEQLWPDLFHLYARAGWTIAPKFLKENVSPVIASIALGAAIQYADRTRLWVNIDLHKADAATGANAYPGHSLQALRSALLLAYWTGAETIYIENLDYHNVGGPAHPDASHVGSLVAWSDANAYEVTAHGEVARSFQKEYVVENPRRIHWRDYRPRVAIVRMPDGVWGQRGTLFRDRLLGNRDRPTDDIAHEWIEAWSILTHGRVSPLALSIFNANAYPDPIDFFVPLDSVAVFDHLVEGAVLESVECFVVCGHALSAPSFAAIAERVAAGARCVIARRLYEPHAGDPSDPTQRPPGDWVVVEDFADPAVATALAPFLGEPDVARFRFAHHTVEFRPSGAPDGLDVNVVYTGPAGVNRNALPGGDGSVIDRRK